MNFQDVGKKAVKAVYKKILFGWYIATIAESKISR